MITKTQANGIEAFEMWMYRKMLRIPWTDKITNAEVLSRAGEERKLSKTTKISKLNILGT